MRGLTRSLNVVTLADMTRQTATKGRPVGLLINPEAARFVLADRSQSSWAKSAQVSTAHLSEILKGSKGVAADVADRLAVALEVPAGVIFPELVQFRTQVRHFEAPKVAA